MKMHFEFKEVDKNKNMTYEDLPEGMFKIDDGNRISIGYKFGAFSVFFEQGKMVLGNTIQRAKERIFLPLPNVKIIVEEL